MNWLSSFDVELSLHEVRVSRRSPLSSMRRSESLLVPGPSDAASAASADAWVPSLQCMARAFASLHARGAGVRLLVSDHFSRYALVPWSESLVSDAERLAFARTVFKQLFGTMADTWAISLDDQPAGQPSIACAIDRDLLDSVREVCAANRLRLLSAAPLFSDRYNRHRRKFDARAFCVAHLEPGRMTLAFRGASGWLGIRTVRMQEAGTAELAAGLRQEAAAIGAPAGGPLFLIGREEMLRRIGSLPGWNVVRHVDGRSGDGRQSQPRSAAPAAAAVKPEKINELS